MLIEFSTGSPKIRYSPKLSARSGPVGNEADVITPEIQALAAGLRNDPVKIYEPKDGDPMPDESDDNSDENVDGADSTEVPGNPDTIGDNTNGKKVKIYVNGVPIRNHS